MGIFNSIFGKGSDGETSTFPWVPLEDIAQLDAIENESETQTVAIFKHSVRCGISAMVKRGFENEENSNVDVKLYYLDLINYRPISNEIAERFGVVHESPQLIVLKNKEVITTASHGAINEVDLASL
ncbi:bacillithiol system redox-active protein YtxJ [Neptunitalea lumnitzerae]|uniref:Thioredoxin family protein n=1 Tax=Neptunitalea lumnitzerae TaxID=2965509 RepID=A0ABQ5MIJ5_9FLAO|nr:bacillithiol system redox-active protein YtxJ [Neptunitalea sp. Y10]GLB49214.1 thioredoxin family protein [Neptunitalea sp. Y10]